MADNLTVAGNRTVRAKDIGSAERLLQYLGAVTATPTVVSFQKLSIGTTAGTLASFCSGAALPTGATHALVQAGKPNAGKIFWRDDGTNADASTATGFELAAGDPAEFVSLSTVTLDADTAAQVLYVSFRRYDQ